MNLNIFKEIKFGPNDINKRLDKIIRKFLNNLPLSIIYKSLRKGEIAVNGKKVSQSYVVESGDKLYINKKLLPPDSSNTQLNQFDKDPIEISAKKQTHSSIKSIIIYENNHIIAVNKPWGVLVHGKNSIDEKIKLMLSSISAGSLSFSPGPLNRLDRNTTGLMFFSKSLKGAQVFSSLLKNRLTKKYYIGLFDGEIRKPICIKTNLVRDFKTKKSYAGNEGKESKTEIKPILTKGNISLCLVIITTGRTHQIRAHASELGFPLTGDSKYGGSNYLKNYILHSYSFTLKDFNDVLEFKNLSAPLQDKTKDLLNKFFTEREIDEAIKKIG